MNTHRIRLILDNVRSAHNVGAILRSADACGVELVAACGYTPYPVVPGDSRPPHVQTSNTKSIAKTALGAQTSVPILHYSATTLAITEARAQSFKITVLEQSERSLNLYRFIPEFPLALVVGNEIDGVSTEIQALSDAVVELPMLGSKESFNAAVAASIAMFHLRFGV
jgi:tRNA G18 (ribose-2'-O)-methylase SpoU